MEESIVEDPIIEDAIIDDPIIEDGDILIDDTTDTDAVAVVEPEAAVQTDVEIEPAAQADAENGKVEAVKTEDAPVVPKVSAASALCLEITVCSAPMLPAMEARLIRSSGQLTSANPCLHCPPKAAQPRFHSIESNSLSNLYM